MAKIETPTAWVGWISFAATLLVLVGVMQIVQGLGAIFNPDFFVATESRVFVFNLTTWGWVHLVLGTVALASGVGVLAGATWARLVAIVITVLAIVSAIAYITTFPLWSTFVVVIGAFVVYALTVHGTEVNNV